MSTPPWGQEPPPDPYGQQPGAPYQPYGQPYGQPDAQPYAQPGSPYGAYPTPPQTNGLAIGSLVVSVASLVVCCGLSGVVGAILGHVARRQIRQQPDQTGAGLALAGIIVGSIATGIFVLVIVFWIIAFASLSGSFGP